MKYGRDYDAQHFADLFHQHGEQVDGFFSEPYNEGRLDGSVDARKPAGQLVAKPLLARFGKLARDQRFRQFIGHFIRHVMAKRGYEIDQLEVRIRDGILFTCGARYRERSSKRMLALPRGTSRG